MKPALCIVVCLLGWSFGTRTVSAATGDPVRVAVDWSQLSDTTVERCRLGGLQSLLLQTLIEAGYAIVDKADDRAIQIAITEESTRVTVAGRADDATAVRHVRLPQRCDGTIGIDLQAAVRAVADELRPSVVASTPIAPPPPAPIIVTHEVERPAPSHLRLAVGAGVSGSSTSSLFGVPVVRLTRRLASVLLGVQLDAGIRSSRDVTVVEPVLSVLAGRELLREGRFAIAVSGSAGLLGHVFTTDNDSGGHVDGRFGVPVDLSWKPVTLSAMPFARLRPVTHRTTGGIAYQADRFGLLVTVTMDFEL